ncbi:MAG: RNA polymerase sigma factor [Planctomycetota bacterium]|jgi:RNA polymerase sigma-70 factor (ECF subfamily)
MIEDEVLKWRFKSGSKAALQSIYEKYRDYLLTLAMAIVNDASLAEDAVHDVFVAFAQSTGTFKLRGSLKSYLATCALNRCRDQIRAHQRQMLSQDDATPVQSEFGSPDKRMISDEQSRQVADAMAQLPDEQREVIALHLNAGMKLRDIAGLQNVSVSTIKGRYRYGLKKLRSTLDGRL